MKPTRLSWQKLESLAGRIVKEIPRVVSVTYNIGTKPPSTIEAI
jgi:GMP synthase (glutamine-hydrolysing)